MSKKLTKKEALALAKQYLDLPKIGSSINAKRLETIVDLMGEEGEVNLQKVVDNAFDGSKDGLNILSKTIDDIFEKAKANGLELKMVRDNYKGKPLHERRLWIEGDEVMLERLLEEMESSLSLPESNIQSHAIMLNKKNITICYAQKDKGKVSNLKELLEERVNLLSSQKIEFIYYDDDLLGENANAKITQNIEKCDFVLCCESPAFYTDREVIKHFLKQENTDKQKLCIAIQQLGENANRQICSNDHLYFYEKLEGTKNCYSEIKGTTTEKYARDLAERIIEKFNKIEVDYKNKTEVNISKLEQISLPNEHYIENKAERNSFTKIKGKSVKEESDQSRVILALDLLNDWLSSHNKTTLFALLGQYGMGKTFTSKVFAKKQIEKFKKNRNDFLPIYFDLRDFDLRILDVSGFDIWKIIEGILHKRKKADDDSPLTAKDIKDFWQRFNVVFIFDGLDEVIAHIGNKQIEQMFISEIFKLVPNYRSNIKKENKQTVGTLKQKMLLTCRTDYFKSIAEQASFFQEESRKDVDLKEDYEIAILLPFDEFQIKQYLSQVFMDKDAEQLYSTFESIHNLAELAERPVLLNFLGEIIDDLESLRLSEKKITTASVYERIVNKSFYRDNGKHEIPIEIKESLLEEIAAFLWKRADRRIEFSKLATFMSEYLANGPAAMKKLYFNKEEEALYKDLRNATLLVRSDEKDFGFSHTSVQEYFLARYIINKIQLKDYLSLNIEKVSQETVQFCIDLIVQMTIDDIQFVNEGISEAFIHGNELCRKLLFDLYLADYNRDQQIKLSQPINVSGLTLEDYTLEGKKDSYFNLKNTNFQDTLLCNWKLSYVDLDSSDFTSSKLMRCHFHDVKMNGADFSNAIVYGKWRKVEVKKIKKSNADFGGLFVFKSDWPINNDDPKINPNAILKFSSIRHKSPQINYGHTSDVNYFAIITEKRALSSSYDNTLILWDLQSGKTIHHFKGHTSAVLHCAIVNESRAISCSSDKTLILWDLDSGKVIHRMKEHSSIVQHCAIVNDKRALSCSDDNTLILWDLDSGNVIHRMKEHVASVRHCAIVNDKRALSCSDDYTLILWDLDSGKVIHRMKKHIASVRHCAIVNDKRALSCSDDHTLILWDLENGKVIHQMKEHSSNVSHCALVNKKRALSCSNDNTIILWDLDSGKAILQMKEHSSKVNHCVTIKEKLALSCADDNTMIMWDLDSGKAIRRMKEHSLRINHCALINENLAISCSDTTLMMWDLESGKATLQMKGDSPMVENYEIINENQMISSSYNTLVLWDLEKGKVIQQIACPLQWQKHFMLRNENRVISTSYNTLILWDLESGQTIHQMKGHSLEVRDFKIVNKNLAISSAADDTLVLWDLESGQAIHQLIGHKDWVVHCAIINENRAISCSLDNNLILWDLESGQAIQKYVGHTNWVRYCSIVNENRAISYSFDNTLILWDLESGQVIHQFKGHTNWILHCAIINENRALSCSEDKTLILWDLESGQAIQQLEGHTDEVNHCIVVNENLALSCSNDNTLILWDLERGQAIQKFVGHNGAVIKCTMFGKSKVISCSNDGSIRIWDLYTGKEVMSLHHLQDNGHAVIRNNILTDYSENAWEHIRFEGVDENGNKKLFYFDEVMD
jgi:WD40 repeat protein